MAEADFPQVIARLWVPLSLLNSLIALPPRWFIQQTLSHEQTPACKDMNLTVDIVSPKSSIRPCEEITMKAEISGTSQDGRVLFNAAAFPADWEIVSGYSSAELGQDVGTNGKVVKGLEPGTAVIKASPVGPTDNNGSTDNNLFGVFYLTVEEPVATLTPSDPVLDVGQKLGVVLELPGL